MNKVWWYEVYLLQELSPMYISNDSEIGIRTSVRDSNVSRWIWNLFRKYRLIATSWVDVETNNWDQRRGNKRKNFTIAKLSQANQNLCEEINGDIQLTCQNIVQVINKDNANLTQLSNRLNMIYQISNLKRINKRYGVYKQNYSELWIREPNKWADKIVTK